MKPVVSIITPTFNHEEYIGRCIDSVLAQGYKEWELIIIDDSSTDRTFLIAQKYAKKDARIRLIRHTTNWGIQKLSKTYNQALKVSKGDFIALLEGDDFWVKDKLRLQVKSFNNRNIILSFGNAVVVSNLEKPLKTIYYKKPKGILENRPLGSILIAFADLNFYLEPLTIMIRKNALSKIGGFKSDKYYPFIDFPTWFNLSLMGEFTYVNKILGYYRKHEKSSWFEFSLRTKSRGRKEVQKALLAFINNHKKELKDLNLEIKNVIKRQKVVLKSKDANKDVSILFHFIAFNNKEESINMAKKILTERAHIDIEVYALLLLVIYPIIKIALTLTFIADYAYYCFYVSILDNIKKD